MTCVATHDRLATTGQVLQQACEKAAQERALTECGVTVEQAGTKHLAGGGLGSHQDGKAGRRAGGAEAAVSATQLWLLTPASSCRRKSLTSVPSRSRTSA